MGAALLCTATESVTMGGRDVLVVREYRKVFKLHRKVLDSYEQDAWIVPLTRRGMHGKARHCLVFDDAEDARDEPMMMDFDDLQF